jgi:invasion protein IalB
MPMRSHLVAVLTGALLWTGAAHAQQPAKPKAAPAPAATPSPAPQQQGDAGTTPPPGWAVRCNSVSRDAPLECAMEQNAVLTKTGQLIVLINIRAPADTRVPLALIQLPLGLNLPVGAKLQVDEGKATDLQIQTCENRGCYASTPISADLLAALKSGKQLKISFQNMAKETIAIPMPLTDFAAAYERSSNRPPLLSADVTEHTALPHHRCHAPAVAADGCASKNVSKPPKIKRFPSNGKSPPFSRGSSITFLLTASRVSRSR